MMAEKTGTVSGEQACMERGRQQLSTRHPDIKISK
jgi:hypothetical protein